MPLEGALLALSSTLLGGVLGLAVLLRTRLRQLRLAIRRAEAWQGDAQYTARALGTLAQVQRLAEGGVALGTDTVREIHKGIASIPFGILEAIPATRDTTRIVRALHDQTSDVVYGSIGLINRVLGRGLRRGLGLDSGQRGPVRDPVAFQQFLETRPTPAEFRLRYPDVELVLPGGEMATALALRADNSRYFARLDAGGHIVDGEFR